MTTITDGFPRNRVLDAKTRDRALARERMRVIRARSGGLTDFDRARNYAAKRLREEHKDEFDGYRREYIRWVVETDASEAGA